MKKERPLTEWSVQQLVSPLKDVLKNAGSQTTYPAPRLRMPPDGDPEMDW